MPAPLDTFACRATLEVAGVRYDYCDLPRAAATCGGLERLPFTLRILLENLLRFEDGSSVTADDIRALFAWVETRSSTREIAFRPARVLMQDFTGVPAVVDLAALRDALAARGGDPQRINPRIPVDLVIDHSVTVDSYGNAEAFAANVALEMERNFERYALLRWAQQSFRNFRVVPPGTGICHQVNLEHLARTAWSESDATGRRSVYADTLVGTDSHTTMINGLGVLGWGVGGIEAEAALLGQPISMLIPEVIGVRLSGRLRAGVTATDLVLTVTELLRKRGVVGKFVEFCGPGLAALPLADRATIANMSPEFGATCAFFPVDQVTIDYLRLTGRPEESVLLAEAFARAQQLWHDPSAPEPLFTDLLELDLATIVPCLAGPKRPQDRVTFAALRAASEALVPAGELEKRVAAGDGTELRHGDVVIAAITSCTNTSNPAVMLAAGLLAQKAVARGLARKPWVKSSLAPGSKVVSDYLRASGLQEALNALGFQLVGYGCTTCIGNSGPLDPPIAAAVQGGNLTVAAVLSGNRNFEGRIHPQVKANWLASPPLVVAFALAGTTRIDLERDPLGHDREGRPVYLRELWPSDAEVAAEVARITAAMFRAGYSDLFAGDAAWQALPVPAGSTFAWDPASTYVRKPPFFSATVPLRDGIEGFAGGRILALLGDSITTDHISPAGSIRPQSPAGVYLQDHGVAVADFNAYGARRGNHEVMMRGTFANIRLRNELLPGSEGGVTRHQPSGDTFTIFDAAQRYEGERTPLLVVAGREYGSGSSRDWAAKGALLLGVRAVLAESFERIHRSNLVGMGILPLQFPAGVTRVTLGLDGSETIAIEGSATLTPKQQVGVVIHRANGSTLRIEADCRIDTADEAAYYRHGGILNYVLAGILAEK